MIRNQTFVITGPESTGKTTLAAGLAGYFKGAWFPEYARDYVTSLRHKYTLQDVEHIARYQCDLLGKAALERRRMLFLDTDLIIIKVWLREVYKEVPLWLQNEIRRRPVTGYLLCATDLPWIPDPVRENPGHKREILFKMYRKEIEDNGFIYRIVTGTGEERLDRAVKMVNEMMEETMQKKQ